ncbi:MULTISPECIES: TadE/TadG family type IV pilus assembly protein [unclassified Sphingomonas]|uniref:TadE/TadG family type IV pilus assembly protein n=1 Tax=unclassified Sphingomonas TaxID=196159 RepID=UPI00215082E3|nr:MULTISPECIES: TadE/TadG family type IV pilus assembly protein [unclassified Sphingomonas]MCR5872125.1 pilus assembly protein [Sphingomonas sp. J344]UUX99568.1 pilus assembly protein [Sphingomonas sp. J315]
MKRRFSLRRFAPGALRRDESGATIVEFAMVAPVLGFVLLGAFDVAHTLYTRAALQGVVQKTARDSTLESGGETATQALLDEKVKAQAKALANNATITITRRFYRTFSEAAAARAETWTDTNSNGVCDAGEPYEDANRNNVWDRDGGNAGQGGAKDATLYTVSATYPRMFPFYNLIGGSRTTTITASTVLRNQPFGDQGNYGAMQVRNCT